MGTAPDDADSGRLAEARGADKPFARFGTSDIRDLIAEFPLAWVCARGAAPVQASLLPLIGEYGPDGRLSQLVGHMARRNPLAAALSAAPDAVLLFKGPDGYVSPEQAGRRDWAPTWNYAQLCIEAQVSFRPEETDAAVARLVEVMEAGRAAPWGPGELGARYELMARQIIGFRAEVTGLSGAFKLGQDEAPETLRCIFDRTDDPALVRWMRRMNEGRL